MPELPEVHTTVEGLRKAIIGRTIRSIWSDFHIGTAHGHKKNLKNEIYYKDFAKKAIGSKIKSVERRGKNILIHLSNRHTIIVHMKMTGHLMVGDYQFQNYISSLSTRKNLRAFRFARSVELRTTRSENNFGIWKSVKKGPLSDPQNQFIHFVATLSGGSSETSGHGNHLVLSDMRKFASICIVKDDGIPEHEGLASLGPDPFDMDKKKYIEKIHSKRHTPIKKVLLDQSVIAGIGNIYSDEILWDSAVHPLSRSSNIPDKAVLKMYNSMRKILTKSIKLGGDSMSDYRNVLGMKGGFQNFHKAYRRTGQKCPKSGCGGIIRRITVGGRSSHFCPIHQKKY
jgi:formamidopyrimidine-DNA glycosylase